MKVSGSGVVPSYVLKPRFGVARVEVTDDKLVELKISIHNTGSCPLSFQLKVINILEGNIPRAQDQSREETSKRKKKGKIDGESQGKSPRKIELTDDLRQHEESAIFGGELKQSTDSSCFSFWNFDEHMQLSVREGKKVDFSIRFQRPSKGGKEKEGVETASKGKKKEEKMERKKEIEKTNYCHVAVLKLILGGSILVQDIVMICLIK
ncbi:uncharacterized protein LOC143179609 [Calliopsis andreniformis]|uniref:uncharacterized protein LOC143179609 n=1 Tax=Calliopsis andreniformis TaxID=337506 RepID=UPI003FCED3B5